ncbi:MAG: M23 family metallopeptidase, partial [Saprospiraceae bacterium]|nr:M23 family metallopeptidase [Saprospiraceae bacterium]
RKTGIHCTNGIVIEPPMGDDSKIIEQTGEGQYIVIKCNEQYPISFGFTDRDIYIAYRHMYSFEQNFSIGDTLKKGDILGQMGQTGITSNYHLHLSALRRACDDDPSKRFANVHPMYLFNPHSNPHLIRKMEFNQAYNNDSNPIDHQEMNPEVYFLNYETFLPGEDPIIRIALPYYHTSIDKIIMRDTSEISPHSEWTFDLIQRSTLPESERDMNYWDMNESGDIDTVFIHHFNRGTSASFLYDSHKNEGHYDAHPSKQWPITDTGIYRSATYILDIKIVNFSGGKEDLQVEISDIWGNRIKAEPN